MSTALSTQTAPAPRRSALIKMASRLDVEEGSLLKILKETVCKGCSDAEVMAFSVVANEYLLNPFIKQIYAFPAKGGGIVPVVSIDGWVAMVNNHPMMDGMDFEMHYAESGDLEAITCTIWRKDRSKPVKVTEILSECVRNTEPWKMVNRMLRHKALMQCARYAFGFSGITDEDEGADMRATVHDMKPRTSPFSPSEPAARGLPEPEEERAEAPVVSDVPTFKAARKKEGTTNGKKWTRYDVAWMCSGERIVASTFSTRLGEIAMAMPLGAEIRVIFEGEGKDAELMSLEALEGGSAE